MTGIAAVVLAAGAGRRFTAAGGSGSKVMASVDGRPLIAHVLEVASEAGLDPIVVVLPPDTDASSPVTSRTDLPILSSLRRATGRRVDILTVVNPRAAEGMSTSVASGLSALEADGGVDACVILLADQPRIDPEVITRVVAEWRRTGRPVRTDYEDGPGHPVLLPRETWTSLREGMRDTDRDADEGARGMLAGLGATLIEVAGPMPVDVDTPADLVHATERATEGTTERVVGHPDGHPDDHGDGAA
jgi:molybdenum cofactor cytidylyltransferase